MARIQGTPQPVQPLSMVLSKQRAAELQINCAIRNVFAGECPVSNHVIVMSAREILHQYAKRVGVRLRASMEERIKPEFLSEFRKMWKERYNFLKHSDRDADIETDFTNVQMFNEAETFLNSMNYRDLFGEVSAHMGAYMAFMMGRFPNWFDLDGMQVTVAQREFLLATSKDPRKDTCRALREVLRQTPLACEELGQAQRMSFAEPVKVEVATRDESGRYYGRERKESE